ncbi:MULTISPECIES: chaplin [Streptomycetaceae]|uniref:LPXTG-motif cell wall anchor domain protein n=1 Tax=Streptantibioticus cattleyicolor (strain ATCC 35852 / DSM 46488 / JCM 4925 / NBRC 14057 / NRRL 8057) TaxID=1003195 RepID=F8JXY3_STREN|nr:MULTISPECIES: chaplin [Streptomycetaceae]AEW93364.1 LPXTG-motif cell wall anchor domain protein [Streptantibioticus cattleyicolor NRRL 8057 = DSM 46488]MYS58080.1 DUF320 domain-containing protein [Streptomyces sp. SID5468]CCB73720.1 conserved exported protein of unknown function [Streptantibioticus cattleyicolor NRRL 8057 = DSM 46488]
MNTAKKAALVLVAAGFAAGTTAGNAFAHEEEHHHVHHHHYYSSHRTKVESGSIAKGAAVNSPGVISGNVVQVPIDIPINACGLTVDIIGILNPAFGNNCVNGPIVREEDRERGYDHVSEHHERGGYGHGRGGWDD